jgi:uroporphyrinogen III methyltransferase/synthase
VAEATASALAGKRVVITRAASQSSELFEKLAKRGAGPILLPLVSFAVPEDYAPLDAALLDWEEFDWVLFTSANAVHAVVTRSGDLGRNLNPSGKRPHVAVVGPATREEAEGAGFSVDYLARTHLGVALAEELGERLRAQRVFLPRSDRANPDLPAALQRLGAKVTEVIAYRTLPPSDVDQERVKHAVPGQADAILFFSPTAVHNFAELAGREQLGLLQSTLAIVAIGPITAGALHESGVQRMVVAADTTAAAVVDALEEYFAGTEKPSTAGATHQ